MARNAVRRVSGPQKRNAEDVHFLGKQDQVYRCCLMQICFCCPRSGNRLDGGT